MAEKKFTVMKILLVIGMLLSLYLLYEHFSTTPSDFCKFGNSFDCNIVNKSPYSNLDGISYLLTIDFKLPIPFMNISDINMFLDFITANAFLGFLTLLFLFGLVNAYLKGKGLVWVAKERTVSWMKGLTLFGVVYGLYLLYIQHFILKTYCILCLSLDAILLISLFIVWGTKK